MKLEDTREAYQELSSKSSELARTLCFSAVAIIWVFKEESETGISIPAELLMPSLLAVLALTSDLLQYVSSTICWGIFGRLMEIKCNDNNDSFKAPAYINWPAIVFFYLKLFLVAMTYLFLSIYILDKFK